jgi:hypothetical protein
MDERVDDSLTRSGIEAEQSRGLSRRQPQPWHFIELCTYALEQYWEVHMRTKSKR